MELVRVQDSDYQKAYDLFMTFKQDENGFINCVYGYDYNQFLQWIEKKRNWSEGKDLPEGFVPDTTFLLSDDDKYVGVFNLRHCLNDFLREGPGHIGYGISSKFRGKGYATEGLKLTLAKAREMSIHEAYLSCNKDNTASLRVQLKNGAYIHHENDTKYFTRINSIDENGSRQEIVSDFYTDYNEETRLERSRHGQLEYAITMEYVHRYLGTDAKILEVGAGTGRYSIALAKEGYDVTSVELVEKNIGILKEKSAGLSNLRALQGDATDLSCLKDDSYDVTLVFGPMYHLYEDVDVNKAIDEAIRVTRPGGTILFAFISVFAIMYSNYFQGNWKFGEEENFSSDYKVKHFKEQLFTGYDVVDFEKLFETKAVEWITTAGVDGLLEPIEHRLDFSIPEEDFEGFKNWYLAFSEKRELLGHTNHLLYICRKK
ncbi:GNAT family N-acetyltransferase [Pseudobutyrivibrio xylanivorans]|uniref:GNAT family N-acetyltransferase n=1 Tax=Pseudobutyrivibrio xylanivorans TaxID=185007 RepID=A0A5P6VS14_PSEXY|nr:GNAT family N-acetyltransferase [Pseudobutyrivibrio xylanivorans]QFJ55376.1 GNAT family N-acetyltransferase [Pseudobutyrivibrio xylanivorans]